jgi:hypothetical protein
MRVVSFKKKRFSPQKLDSFSRHYFLLLISAKLKRTTAICEIGFFSVGGKRTFTTALLRTASQ